MSKNAPKKPPISAVGISVINDVSGDGTHEVGKKAANRLGIYDMSGNVYELCYDWYGTVSTGEETDPTGALSGSGRVIRGGSCGISANLCSVFCRNSISPSAHFGFRLVRASSK